MKKAIRVVVFMLIFVLAFSYADRLLMRKETRGWWNVTAKIDGFYNSPKNEYDVIFYGSSNAYCSFNPLEIWDKTGVKSYVFATQQQPLWATYHYMVDSFKTQKPDLAVLDVLMVSKNDEYYDDGVNYTYLDNMPLSKNKLELISVSAPKEDWFDLLFNFTKYHSRWNELSEQDFTYRKEDMSDYSKGYYVLTYTHEDVTREDVSGVLETRELSAKNMAYLNKIIDLCKNEDVELMLVKTPSNSSKEEKMYYNTVEKLAEEKGVAFVDYNEKYEEIGLDIHRDFFDVSHLNTKGAEKFTDYFVKITKYFNDKERLDEDWLDDFKKYQESIENF